jgi:hypothetical protein
MNTDIVGSNPFNHLPHTVEIILQVQPLEPADEDPLISPHWQQIVMVSSFLLLLALIIAIGVVNRQVEYALMFAMLLSIVLIIPLMFL